MTATNRPVTPAPLLWGAALIVGGVLLLPAPWAIIELDVRDLVRQWPLILFVVGAAQLLSQAPGERGHGGWLMAVGAWFLLNRWADLDARDTWPLWLVVAGIMLCWTTLTTRPTRPGHAEKPHAD